MCAVIAYASGSMSDHVYEATVWPALRKSSRPVAMPPQSSTSRSGLSGGLYRGMSSREEGGSWVVVWCWGGPGISLGGVGGFVSDGQCGIDLVGRMSPISAVTPLGVCEWGKKVVWASDIWNTPLMVGSRMSCTRPISRNCAFPARWQ